MPIKSLFEDIPIPDSDLWSFVFDRPREFPDSHTIFVDADTARSYSFGQVKQGSIQFGKGLKHLFGWKKGDVLGVFSPNNIDVPVVNFGCIWAGGIPSTANPTYTATELAHQMKDAGAKAIITQKAFLPVALEAAAKVGIPKDRVLLLGDARDPSGTHRHWTDITAAGAWIQPSKTKVGPKDICFIVYSSGTTGLPKGVPLTHGNLLAGCAQFMKLEGKSMYWEVDGELGVLPFFHIYGLAIVVNAALVAGIRCVVVSKFDLEQACRLIQDHRLTFVYVPPPIVLALSKHPVVDKYDLSSLRFINSAAAPVSQDLVDQVWERIHVGVKQGWGLSETSPTVTIQAIDEWKRFGGSVGKLIPNMQAKIVDPDGKELPTGEAGEILLRGPNVFNGYWKKPELDKDTFTDGWYRTGDVGYVNATGHFYITDRIKELIKYKGFQVAPAELEGIIIGREDVADVCVVGVYSEADATELPRAYIVLAAGQTASDDKAKEISEWLAGRVAPPKKLRGGVRFVKEIPKSAAGKILRRILRDEANKENKALKAKL